MRCWTCGADVDYIKKIPFKATCDACSAWLHVCRNCKNYSPGKPNDCAVPGTEFVADREKFNLCEEFDPLGNAPDKPDASSKDRFNQLFGD